MAEYLRHPTVLVDMDGPLADFDAHFFKRCAEEGYALDCELADQRHRFATDHIPDRTHRNAARTMVDTAGWFRDLPPTPGALDGINELFFYADVWICTKPLDANPTCRDDKADWIARHLGNRWMERLIIAPDKSMVRGTVLLDDAPKISWIERALWNPIIFRTPWNGAGSKWAHFPHWSWGESLEILLNPKPNYGRIPR